MSRVSQTVTGKFAIYAECNEAENPHKLYLKARKLVDETKNSPSNAQFHFTDCIEAEKENGIVLEGEVPRTVWSYIPFFGSTDITIDIDEIKTFLKGKLGPHEYTVILGPELDDWKKDVYDEKDNDVEDSPEGDDDEDNLPWMDCTAATKCALLSSRIYKKKVDEDLPAQLKFILYNDYSSEPFSSGICWGIFLEEISGICFIVFRGTAHVRDWILDVSFLPDNSGSKLHGGYERAINTDIGSIEAELSGLKPKEIFITGHSLGGGLAHVLFHKFKGGKYPCKCITFAAPMVSFENKPLKDCTNIVNAEDIIPHTPRLARKRDFHKLISVGKRYQSSLVSVIGDKLGAGRLFVESEMAILDVNYPLSDKNIYFKEADDEFVIRDATGVSDFITNAEPTGFFDTNKPFKFAAHSMRGYIKIAIKLDK